MYAYPDKEGYKTVAEKWHLPEANTIRDVAEQVGLLGHYVRGYKFLGQIVHLDPVYVSSMVKDTKVIQHDPGSHWFILNETLWLNFTYFLNIYKKINRMFSLGKETQLENLARIQKSLPRKANVSVVVGCEEKGVVRGTEERDIVKNLA